VNRDPAGHANGQSRIQKSELAIRPVWHQRADRVQAHILVCFLAYVLWKSLEQWQRRAGLGQSPRTILDELRRIQSTDVVLPTEDGRELRLRCVLRPDAARAGLLDRLGLDLPERLRIRPPPGEREAPDMLAHDGSRHVVLLFVCPRIDEIPDFLLVDWRQDMNHTDQIGQRGRIVIGPSQGKLERRADEALRLAARMGLACAGDGRGSRRDDGATS